MASAVSKINFPALTSSITNTSTLASLAAFRQKHADLQKTLAELKQQKTTIAWENYQSTLGSKHSTLLSNAKATIANFKPQKLDLKSQIAIIDKHHVAAVNN